MNCLISITKYLCYQYGVLSKPRVTVHFRYSNKKMADSGKIMYQQRPIYWQSKCQLSNKFAKLNNSYSSFCEVTPKHFSFRSSMFDVIHKIIFETEVFWGHLIKTTVTIVCFGGFSWNLALWLLIYEALWKQNFVQIGCFFVNVTKIYTNREVFLCNAILVKEIFWYRYSIISNSAQK